MQQGCGRPGDTVPVARVSLRARHSAQAVEERRTVQDSQGRRETTVTRRRGDQAFITTTKEDGQNQDYREDVVNMDDREWGSGEDARSEQGPH